MRGLGEDDTRLLHEHAARLGQLDLTLGAMEERDSKLFFELLDLMAERRLAEVQPLRSTAKMQRLGQRDDVAKMTQLHPGGEAYCTSGFGDTWHVLVATQYVFP